MGGKASGNKERSFEGRLNHKAAGIPWPAGMLYRNARSVWTIATTPFKGAHFAVMPLELALRCTLAGSAEGDLVLDPFAGAGTVGLACKFSGRDFLGIELSAANVRMAEERIATSVHTEDGIETVDPDQLSLL